MVKRKKKASMPAGKVKPSRVPLRFEEFCGELSRIVRHLSPGLYTVTFEVTDEGRWTTGDKVNGTRLLW
jgi:hypothetical protein